MSPQSLLLTIVVLQSCFMHGFVYPSSITPLSLETLAKMPLPPKTSSVPFLNESAAPAPCPRSCSRLPPLPPRSPTFPLPPPPPRLPGRLKPRQPPNNPGPLSSQNSVLFITQELKRNITSDPNNYTASWVGNNYCLFKGYYCDIVPDKNITGLIAVNFNGANFRGNLNFYRYIRFLPDICIFHVNSNNFSGLIFPNINKLRFFFELDLSNNGFSGSFPVSLIGSRQLTFVDLRFNTFSGPVPPQLFNLDVDVIFINNNGFTQTIPSTFGNTPALYITLANNRFTGPIPQTIYYNRKTLIEVLFLGNRLTGCLPYEIGYLNLSHVFDVSFNRLTGPIPESFGCMARMQFLNLAHNKFYGPIPESLCMLPRAYNFTLSNNYFTQVGPQCRRLIRLGTLDVRKNCIFGLRGQRNPRTCAAFFSRARTCPRPEEFSLVPCTLPLTTASELPMSESRFTTPPSPRTYAALEKPRH
ncbi:hypothetical protein RJ641_032159 [Dillenia turbinata]|uniref:Leucine-rich repeat-containing N-terminal plant-type domain-containing protein n=1 Tax=Dillenia turbinata TaxID=194707 RepID=A0AAN8VZH8_9MAGN